jgi:hypothetical protein
VRDCGNCGYLLAPDWTDCKRCGAEAPRVEPAAPAARWMGGTTIGGDASGTAPTIASPAIRDGFDPRYSAPARIGFGDPTTPSYAPPWPRDPWSSGTRSVAKKSPFSTSLGRALLVVLLTLGGFAGWKYMQAVRNAPPEEVAAFLDGEGDTYTPVGLGYSVRMPFAPTVSTQTETVYGATVTISMAVIEREDWELGVGVFDLPVQVPDAQADSVLREAVSGGTAEISGTLEEQASTTHQGLPAVDAQLKADDGHPVHVRVVASGSRIYLVMAHSITATDDIFDELVASFDLASSTSA